MVELAQFFWPERVDSLLSFRTHLNEPRLAQHSQMPRDRRLCQLRERRSKLSGGALAQSEEGEYLAALRLSDCGEHVHCLYVRILRSGFRDSQFYVFLMISHGMSGRTLRTMSVML